MAWDSIKVDFVDEITASDYNDGVTDQKTHKTRHDSGGSDELVHISTTANLTNQNDVTGSRAVTTIYRNTTGKPMHIVISIKSSSATAAKLYSDSSTPPTTLVAEQSLSTTNDSMIFVAIVLDDNYYKIEVTTGTPTIVSWIETY